ncbi:MAG: Rpn family recombination-promoting nuclease/putative transposase [bacterium]
MDAKDKVINPHDKFFKEFFSKEKEAREFLSLYLPEDIKKIIDLSTLSISKDSFVEKELQEYFSDILYKVEIKGQTAWIYLLFEHKSYSAPMVSFQLLRYMVKIWEQLLNQKQIHTGFPSIIPFVIYHGKEKWKTDTHFSVLFSPHEPSLSRYIPDFTYLLYDLSHLSDDQIRGAVTLRAFLLLLKYIFHDDFRVKFHEMEDLFKELALKVTGMEYLETFLRYIISATDKISEQDIEEIITKTWPQGGDTLMPTIAEKWIQQGMQQGIEQGMQQGIQQGIQQGMQQGIRQGIQEGMQQGIQQGIRQGIIEAIQLGLELKFGTNGLALFADISKIDDTARLRSIKEAIIIAKEVDEIKGLIKG